MEKALDQPPTRRARGPGSAAGGDEPRDPREELFGNAHVETVEAERLREELVQEAAQGLAADSLDQLADEPAERQGMIGAPRSRRQRRLAASEHVRHVLPVEHAARVIDARPDVVEPGAVRQELTDGGAPLPALRELRPVPRDRVVVVELPAVDEHVDERRHDALRGGEGRRDRLALPGSSVAVTGPRPQIDDALAAMVDADRRTAARALELPLEHTRDALELGVPESLQKHAGTPRVWIAEGGLDR